MGNIQKITCDIKVEAEDTIKGEIFLRPNEKYTLIIDYPLNKAVEYDIEVGNNGMSTHTLINKIRQFYKKIYQDAETNGVWGHDIGDLYIEGVEVDHKKKTIELHMGS